MSTSPLQPSTSLREGQRHQPHPLRVIVGPPQASCLTTCLLFLGNLTCVGATEDIWRMSVHELREFGSSPMALRAPSQTGVLSADISPASQTSTESRSAQTTETDSCEIRQQHR